MNCNKKITDDYNSSKKYTNGVDLSDIYLREKVEALPAYFDLEEQRDLENKLICNIDKFYSLKLYDRNIDAIYDLVDFYVKSEHFNLAKETLDKAIIDLQKTSNDNLVFELELQKIYLLFEQEEMQGIDLHKIAMESCKKLLKTDYVKNNQVSLAKVKHELGNIYADMSENNRDSALLATISIATFKETISLLAGDNDKYFLGQVYANFGTSYFKYPKTTENNNADLALLYLKKAYNIFNAEDYPEEKTMVILNMIESLWRKESQENFNKNIYNDIINLANEVLSLDVDDEYNFLAREHIENIEKLKELSTKQDLN